MNYETSEDKLHQFQITIEFIQNDSNFRFENSLQSIIFLTTETRPNNRTIMEMKQYQCNL